MNLVNSVATVVPFLTLIMILLHSVGRLRLSSALNCDNLNGYRINVSFGGNLVASKSKVVRNTSKLKWTPLETDLRKWGVAVIVLILDPFHGRPKTYTHRVCNLS